MKTKQLVKNKLNLKKFSVCKLDKTASSKIFGGIIAISGDISNGGVGDPDDWTM